MIVTSNKSYVLTSDLDVPTQGVSAIDALGSDITIDLNGFSITGKADGTNDVVISNQAGTGAAAHQARRCRPSSFRNRTLLRLSTKSG